WAIRSTPPTCSGCWPVAASSSPRAPPPDRAAAEGARRRCTASRSRRTASPTSSLRCAHPARQRRDDWILKAFLSKNGRMDFGSAVPATGAEWIGTVPHEELQRGARPKVPAKDPFYVPPQGFQHATPGTVLRSRDVEVAFL